MSQLAEKLTSLGKQWSAFARVDELWSTVFAGAIQVFGNVFHGIGTFVPSFDQSRINFHRYLSL
jgi:hypothetical protein